MPRSRSLEHALQNLVNDVEQPDPSYRTTNERPFAFYSMLAFVLYLVIKDLSQLATLPPVETITNVATEAAMFLPVILIVLPPVERWIARSFKRDGGIAVVLVPVIIIAIYYAVAAAFQFSTAGFDALDSVFVPGTPWVVNLAIACGITVSLFQFSVVVFQHRGDEAFLRAGWWGSPDSKRFVGWLVAALAASTFIGASVVGWALSFVGPVLVMIVFLLSRVPVFKDGGPGITFSDFFALAPVALVVLLGTSVRFFNHVTLPLVLAALFHACPREPVTREHVRYSFTPARGRDIVDLLNFILLSIAIILPLAIAIGFIDLANFRFVEVNAHELFVNAVVWTYFVGISEEVLFRVFLLNLLRGLVAGIARRREKRGLPLRFGDKHPVFMGLLWSSIIFGLAHAGKGWNYALLAIIAGFAYGLLYTKHRTLFAPILMHMTVDVIAVSFFAASL